jgi:hypothetical protein
MQLNKYHSEIYIAKMNNKDMFKRKLGARISKIEKCLCGCICSFITLFLLIGPFFLFSDFGAIAMDNPIKHS